MSKYFLSLGKSNLLCLYNVIYSLAEQSTAVPLLLLKYYQSELNNIVENTLPFQFYLLWNEVVSNVHLYLRLILKIV